MWDRFIQWLKAIFNLEKKPLPPASEEKKEQAKPIPEKVEEDLMPPPGTSPVPVAQLEDNILKYKRFTNDPAELSELKQVCDKIEKMEIETKCYSQVEAKTGLEWQWIAAIHYRESSLSMLGCLHNGDRVIGPDAMARNLKTTHVPAGLGPWPDWSSAAVDAINRELKSKGWKKAPIGVADCIGFVERFNGLGPRNHGIDSGYVWGGTSEEDLGGYPSDGKWDPRREETRIGAVMIEAELKRRELAASPDHVEVPEVINHPAEQVYEKLRALQKAADMKAAPVEQLIEYHRKNLSGHQLRYWAVVDFSQHSSKKRLYVLDTIGMSFEKLLCSHGTGSDPDNDGNATKFSNVDGSHMSSLGIVRCSETYQSMGETRLRLDGLQPTNSNVRRRAIVMHSASYVNESTGKCGRSWGCTVLDSSKLSRVVSALKGGSLMNLWTE